MIRDVITRGFGGYGDGSFIPTLGYGIGGATPGKGGHNQVGGREIRAYLIQQMMEVESRRRAIQERQMTEAFVETFAMLEHKAHKEIVRRQKQLISTVTNIVLLAEL